jgi:hypothetical protein
LQRPPAAAISAFGERIEGETSALTVRRKADSLARWHLSATVRLMDELTWFGRSSR